MIIYYYLKVQESILVPSQFLGQRYVVVIPVSCLKITQWQVRELVEIHQLTENNLSITHGNDVLVASQLFIFSHMYSILMDKWLINLTP